MKKNYCFRWEQQVPIVKKLFRIMKLTTFLLLISFFGGLANKSFSQLLSLDLKNATLKEALSKIEDKCGCNFLYSEKFIDVQRKISISIENKKLEDALKLLFSDADVKFERKNRIIILSPLTEPGYQQQSLTVSGYVTDSSGFPLPGVTIIVKTTTVGTVTDSNGNYSLPNIPANAVLVFSFVGMKTQEIPVSGKANISIIMEEESVGLEEVVAIGYGTKVKGSLTGSISKIDSQTFETRPITSPLNALQGALPGVTVTRGSGQPGRENYSFQIRGVSSMSGSKPLILIDGIPGDLSLLNPNDIADVTVLKDAAASIYGARAADGVLIVTTKKGKTGRPVISYSGNYGIKTPKFLKKMASTLQMAEMFDEGMKNVGLPGVSQDVFDKIKANAEPDPSSGWMKFLENYPGFYGNTDWMDVVYGNGVQQMHNLSISGGGDNNTYLFSAGYQRDEGIFKYGENHWDRYNLRMNYDFRLSERLTLETRSTYETQSIAAPSQLGTALHGVSRIWSYLPVYNSKGQLWKYQGYANPVELLQKGKSESNYSKFSTNFKGDLRITPDLKLVAQAGITIGTGDENANYPTYTRYNWSGGVQDIANSPNEATYSDSKSIFGSYTAYLEYKKKVSDKHDFNLMAGASHEENDYQFKSITGYNFASNELFTLNLADLTKVEYANFTGNASDWALSSYFGRFSYAFDQKYMVDVTTRIDGSSKFAPSKRWSAVFPAVSVSWNLGKEQFIRSSGTFNNLKLRASWGQSGNQELSFGNYDYISLISITGKYPLGSPNSGFPGAIPNIASEGRTWETIETLNGGLDFETLKSRLTGSFDYYIKHNNNMLVNQQLPATLGGSAPTQNIGKLETKGWDLSISWGDHTGDFKYRISAMVSDSKNKMIELKGNDTYSEGLVPAREGYSLQSYFGYQFDGIIQNTEQLAEYKTLANVPAKIGIGDVMFRDVDGDGKITAFGDPAVGSKGDMIYLGNLLPRYTYSSNIDLSYKNFDLSVFLQGVGKREGVRTADFSQPFYYVWHQPLEYFYGKNWTTGNPEAPYPRIIPGGLGFDELKNWNWRVSAMRINNLAYLRIKTITLAYNLPESFCSKLKMQSVRVYASAQDLFTFSKGTWNRSFDPEETWERTDEQTYPFSSIVSMGLDIKF
jgi:TonB-linked SusC/RagA family outer membrane protein